MYLKRVLEILSKVNVCMLKANVHADRVSRERRNFPQDRQQKKKEFKQRKQIWPCVWLRNKTRRVIKGELRLHDIEKKQGELARGQKSKEEELERSRRLELLKQETDKKLAAELR